MKAIIIILSLLVSGATYAKPFNKQQYEVVKDIIWAADKVEIPRELLLAVCWGESSFRTDAKLTHMDGPTLSYGICQVKLETAQFMDKVYKHKSKIDGKRLKTPSVNAFYAAKFLRYQLNKYHWHWDLAVDAYNKGTAVSIKSVYVKRFNKHLTMIKTELDRKPASGQ